MTSHSNVSQQFPNHSSFTILLYAHLHHSTLPSRRYDVEKVPLNTLGISHPFTKSWTSLSFKTDNMPLANSSNASSHFREYRRKILYPSQRNEFFPWQPSSNPLELNYRWLFNTWNSSTRSMMTSVKSLGYIVTEFREDRKKRTTRSHVLLWDDQAAGRPAGPLHVMSVVSCRLYNVNGLRVYFSPKHPLL